MTQIKNASKNKHTIKIKIMAIKTSNSKTLSSSSLTPASNSNMIKGKNYHHQQRRSSKRKSTCKYENDIGDNNTTTSSYELCDMNSKISFIISRLTAQELEMAARSSSYEYLKNPVPSKRNQFARRIVQKYLESKNGDVDVALEKIKKTLQFRQEIQIDDLITAFDDSKDENENDEEDGDENNTTAEILKKYLSSKKYFVQGYDKYGRSTLYFIPRLVSEHDLEWTLKEAIYSIERAIACSRSEDGTINAVVDFSGFSLSQHSPPLEIGKQFLTTLRSHYAGQINRIYLINTPFSFSFLWNIFSPFIGTNTRDKILIVNGAQSKTRDVLDLYDLEEVPSWLVPGGENNRPLDLDEYLYELSFDTAFNNQS